MLDGSNKFPLNSQFKWLLTAGSLVPWQNLGLQLARSHLQVTGTGVGDIVAAANQLLAQGTLRNTAAIRFSSIFIKNTISTEMASNGLATV